MDKHFDTPFGQFILKRIPDADRNLRAWDNADQYLLNYLADNQLPLKNSNILVVNDSFGALTTTLSDYRCDLYSDSYIAHQSARDNLQRNDVFLAEEHFIKSTEPLVRDYDLVLIKNVKTLALLEDELIAIRPRLKRDAIVIAASMAKNLQGSALEFFNRIIGPAAATLAWKKARLIHVAVDPELPHPDSLYPITFKLDDNQSVIFNLANVFSKHKLDIGSRFFLHHLPQNGAYQDIIDLGCGNGVLALKAAQLYPAAYISCIDESYMAVESARLTLNRNLPGRENYNCEAGNGLQNMPHNSADLILCNPPFHQQSVVGDAIAWSMFRESKMVLRRGGELWVVGNRHLGYHAKLNKLFGNYKVIAANKKFVIIKSVCN